MAAAENLLLGERLVFESMRFSPALLLAICVAVLLFAASGCLLGLISLLWLIESRFKYESVESLCVVVGMSLPMGEEPSSCVFNGVTAPFPEAFGGDWTCLLSWKNAY